MSAMQTDRESAPGNRGLIAVSILGAGLVIASIWFLSRAQTNSTPPGSAAPAGAATTTSNVLSDEELERRYVAEHRPAPAIQAPDAAQSTASQTNQNNKAVILQQAKTKVNRRIVDRMKQYIRNNPNIDTWDVKEQIKERENQGARTQ